MSILTNPLQTTVFLPPNSNDDLVAVNGALGNPAGFGSSQILEFTTPVVLTAGEVIPTQFTCPKPAPLWAFSTANAADKLVIRTINNQSIQLQNPTTINGILTGFNNGYFQPAATQTYIIYFLSGVGRGVGASCFQLQAVVENTIGQYIDLGSVATTIRPSTLPSKSTYTIGTTVALNTTSTLANTVYIDFSNWPVTAGRNTLATGIALLSTQANKSISSAFTNNAGSLWEPFQIVGGQTFAFEIQSQREGYWTGRISIAISQVGVVTLGATIGLTAMSQYFESRYTTVGDTAVSSQEIDSGKLLTAIEGLNMRVSTLVSQMEEGPDTNDTHGPNSSDIHNIVSEISRKNEAAHTEIFRQLAKIMKKIHLGPEEDLTKNIETCDKETNTMNDYNGNVVNTPRSHGNFGRFC